MWILHTEQSSIFLYLHSDYEVRVAPTCGSASMLNVILILRLLCLGVKVQRLETLPWI